MTPNELLAVLVGVILLAVGFGLGWFMNGMRSVEMPEIVAEITAHEKVSTQWLNEIAVARKDAVQRERVAKDAKARADALMEEAEQYVKESNDDVWYTDEIADAEAKMRKQSQAGQPCDPQEYISVTDALHTELHFANEAIDKRYEAYHELESAFNARGITIDQLQAAIDVSNKRAMSAERILKVVKRKNKKAKLFGKIGVVAGVLVAVVPKLIGGK